MNTASVLRSSKKLFLQTASNMIPPPSAGDDLLAKTGYTLAKIAFRKPENPLDFSIKEKIHRKVLMEGNYMSKVHRYEQLKLDNFRLA